MSWSIIVAGTREKIIEALNKEHERLTHELSKKEFGGALPHLIGLVNMNVPHHDHPTVLSLQADGHGYWVDGKQVSGSCSVKLETIPGSFVG